MQVCIRCSSLFYVGGRTDRKLDPAGLRSDIYWALLGLIIARPSYGYALAQRYERTYGELLPLSSQGQIYRGLDALEGKALIEKVPIVGEDRQPKTHYRATDLGIEHYRVRLVARLAWESRHWQEFAEELAVLPPEIALAALDEYEQTCLQENHTPSRSSGGGAKDPGSASSRLAARIAAQRMQSTSQARLSWIAYARHELRAVSEQRGGGNGAA
jgi:DNA-binding PadR family transcriptional regulator